MNTGRTLLILCPSFHGYGESLGAAFEQLGLTVRVHSYDRFATPWEKARNKAFLELPERFGADTRAQREKIFGREALEVLRETSPDLVLVIKGDMLPAEVWTELQDRRIPTVLWLYDELRRTRWDLSRLLSLGPVASYSPLDVARLESLGARTALVPNGFDHLRPWPARPRTAETTMIGARYPRRQELLEQLDALGVPLRAYGRDWSRDLRDRLRTWGGPRPEFPTGRDISRSEAYGIMAASLATLNIHYDQDGFTMRTFEAPGVGGVHLVDRADVQQFYEPGTEALVFTTAQEVAEHVQRLSRDTAWAEEIRRRSQRRTLAEHTLVHRARLFLDLF